MLTPAVNNRIDKATVHCMSHADRRINRLAERAIRTSFVLIIRIRFHFVMTSKLRPGSRIQGETFLYIYTVNVLTVRGCFIISTVAGVGTGLPVSKDAS